ncbi:type I restriction enzyme HsdR N-terminal domain-containing protein [Riemerella columbipharyngis]|uniref:Type I restriction enzyme R protein N terminus (HSDR_N) n=1 Tax=Riemerella columbipharyngis TaxID=1071918 RepID=A0A1G6YLY0_9FLAO|nr:type I restriction enzyme HsdR N-terminal domain-containing protein [Riemerella columbipharyngis]SDD90556.1 Type I restriction enzyme R protein N terminus (HSDR_N) [Riemerella columbipharyngis]
MQLPKLNFDSDFNFNIKRDKDTFFIYDILRKSWIVLTPEEWVRQHWVHHFHYTEGYALSALILEQKININNTSKRIDLLVTQKTEPFILLECKAPNITLSEATFEQAARYNSVIQAPEIILSNGLQHIFTHYRNGEYRFWDKNKS